MLTAQQQADFKDKFHGSLNAERAQLIIDEFANHQAAAVADLNQDISAAFVEAEVQAISDKIDALLAALRAAGLLAS